MLRTRLGVRMLLRPRTGALRHGKHIPEGGEGEGTNCFRMHGEAVARGKKNREASGLTQMNRISYRIYRMISGARYWVPRRFTPAGLLAMAALFAAGVIGVDMDQTVAFQGFALAACLLFTAMILAPFFRGKFAVERFLPRYGSVGQPFTYVVTVRNLAPAPSPG